MRPQAGDIVRYSIRDRLGNEDYAILLVTDHIEKMVSGFHMRVVIVLDSNRPDWGSGVTKWNDSVWHLTKRIA